MRRTLAVSVVAALLVTVLPPVASASASAARITSAGTGRLDPGVEAVLATLPPGEMTTVVVTLREKANLGAVPGATRAARLKGTITALQAKANASQVPLRAVLRARSAQGKVATTTPLWISNAISVTATADVIQDLAARSDVASITPNDVDVVPTAGVPEPNLTSVAAPAVWGLGQTGAGVVVASLDSGVDGSHPDLASRWRGGTNSWYDPYGQNPTPTDFTGHGTAITGVMVGGDAGGTSIGTAPGATWIAAKIFNNSGATTATAIHQAFQWVLDPDRDANTQDAPQVVNGSWSLGGPGCDLSFQPDLQALRTAGILPVFAAGNYGSGGSTSVSPANYPEALAVGAVNNSNLIYSLSSRGPSTCGGRTRMYPDIVAPGVNIRSTDRYGLYQSVTGTSIAAPHAAGALALLLGATPGLSPETQLAALTTTAVDLGLTGPDPAYGNGKLNVLAAYQSLQPQPDFAVTIAPAEVSVSAGDSAAYTVQVTPTNGFAADVSLSLSGLSPEQAAWTFAPATVPAGSGMSELTVSTAAAIPPGSYPLTVTASSGTTSRSATAILTATAPAGTDLTGPATTSLTLTPAASNGSSDVAVHATGDDSATGGSVIASAEYFTDMAGPDGTGTAMSVGPPAPIAALDAAIPAATLNALAEGAHTLFVHASDGAGNWGPTATTSLLVDRTGPTLSAVDAAPNPTQLATAVTLSATASDSATAITAAEWFTGTDPGVGNATAMTLSGTGPWNLSSAPINVSSWNPGAYTLNVRARDGAGNWSLPASTILNVGDLTGPATMSLTLTPAASNGSSDVAVHATGDDSATGGSAITAAEYFTDTAGPDGTGTAMSVSPPAPIAGLDATIPAATLNALAEGAHSLFVHARDGAGNWGPTATATLLVDKTGPTLSAVGATPNPTLGVTAVTLSATASDSATAITGAEWFKGADPGVGNATAMTLSGTGPWNLSSAPINVSSWNEGAYTLNVRARDGAGNWSLPASTVLNVRGPLYLSTFGNTNPPAVAGTADDADVYSWSGTAYSRVFDASVAGLPSGANVDGYDRVDATHFYLSFNATTTLPGLGTVQDEDVVYYNAGTWSMYFDGSAHGLGGNDNLDLDAISVAGAVNGTGGTLYFSTLGNTNPPAVGGTPDDSDIYSWSGTAYARVIDANAAPYKLPSSANIDGFVRLDATHFYLSFSADTSVPTLGAVQDEDVIYNNNGVWSVYFNGTGHGLGGTGNLDVDAFDIP